MSMLPMEQGVLPTDFMTFDMVEERLVEAMITCWRHPDRERGWQQLRSHWPEALREASAGDYDARGGDLASAPVVRPASLTRAEVSEMEEAFGWVDGLSPTDRQLVGLVIQSLARGHRQVAWRNLLRPMGLAHGSDGLRKRYGRAIETICARVNGGNARG